MSGIGADAVPQVSMHALLLSLVIAFGQGEPTETYKNPDLDLAFNHPKSWKFQKQRSGGDKAIIPLSSGKTATLEVYDVVFASDRGQWQDLQKQFLTQLHRDVVRQWQEEILSVPLLMTLGQFEAKGTNTSILSGLLYSRTPRKFVFRLTSPSEEYSNLEVQLRTSLQTLRTLDGKTLTAEDPAALHTDEDFKVKPVQEPEKAMPVGESRSKPKVVRGEKTADGRTGGVDVRLYFPKDWTGAAISPTEFKLVGPEKLEIRASIASILDSPPQRAALTLSAAKSLDGFETVSKRDDYEATSKTGALVMWVSREGLFSKKPVASFDAAGRNGDFYWVFSWSGKPTDTAKLKALEALAQGMSLEPKP